MTKIKCIGRGENLNGLKSVKSAQTSKERQCDGCGSPVSPNTKTGLCRSCGVKRGMAARGAVKSPPTVVREVVGCTSCPFLVYPGQTNYCALSKRLTTNNPWAPGWCQLRRQNLTIKLRLSKNER